MPNLLDLLAAPKQEGRKISEGDQKSSGRGGASVLQNSHFFQFPPISCHPAVVGLIGVKPEDGIEAVGPHGTGHHHGFADLNDQCCAFHHLAGVLAYGLTIGPVAFAKVVIDSFAPNGLVAADAILLERPPKSLLGVIGPAHAEPRSSANKTGGVDTEHIFGFITGTDIGQAGEKEVESETTGRLGKRTGSYTELSHMLALEYTPIENLRLEMGAVHSYHDISGVAELDDLRRGAFEGLSLEVRYRLLSREHSGIGFTVLAEPHWLRVDGTSGQLVNQYGNRFAPTKGPALVKALRWFSCKSQEVLCGEDSDRTANSFWDSGTMIHIIGTAHSVQCWSDAIKSGIDCDADPTTVKRFDRYLHDPALLLGVTAIAEELSQKAVEQRRGGLSVAKEVARRLGLRHFFCDPDRDEREALGVSTGVDREAVWASRLEPLSPNETSMIFLCGANHSDTFKRTLELRGLDARIHCDDWTLLKA